MIMGMVDLVKDPENFPCIIMEKCNADAKLDYNDIWSSIIANDGSVQHLEILDDWTKDVFKTSMEIDQSIFSH